MDDTDFHDVLAAVRNFVDQRVIPAEEQIEETDSIPEDLRTRAASMGLFGYALPEEHGGLGLGITEEVLLALEVGRATPAFRSMFGTNNGIAGQVLVNLGTEEQQKLYLPDMASGDLVAAFALTESEAGSDPSSLRTRAERHGETYRINGQKRFITNAPQAGLFIVFARTDPDSTGSEGISVFAVPADTSGVTVGPKDAKMGQRGAATAEVFLDDAVVHADALVGGSEGEGFRAAMVSLARGRLHIAALCAGLAERLISESVATAASTKQGGRVIGDYQLVQAMLADSEAEFMAGRAMVVEAARRYDEGIDTKIGPSAAKLFCSEMVGRVADRAVQIHGGMGYMRTVPVERLYRDARLFRLYEGTSEIQRLIIGRELVRRRQVRTV